MTLEYEYSAWSYNSSYYVSGTYNALGNVYTQIDSNPLVAYTINKLTASAQFATASSSATARRDHYFKANFNNISNPVPPYSAPSSGRIPDYVEVDYIGSVIDSTEIYYAVTSGSGTGPATFVETTGEVDPQVSFAPYGNPTLRTPILSFVNGQALQAAIIPVTTIGGYASVQCYSLPGVLANGTSSLTRSFTFFPRKKRTYTQWRWKYVYVGADGGTVGSGSSTAPTYISNMKGTRFTL